MNHISIKTIWKYFLLAILIRKNQTTDIIKKRTTYLFLTYLLWACGVYCDDELPLWDFSTLTYCVLWDLLWLDLLLFCEVMEDVSRYPYPNPYPPKAFVAKLSQDLGLTWLYCMQIASYWWGCWEYLWWSCLLDFKLNCLKKYWNC